MLHLSNHWNALYSHKKMTQKNNKVGMQQGRTHECIRPEKLPKKEKEKESPIALKELISKINNTFGCQ